MKFHVLNLGSVFAEELFSPGKKQELRSVAVDKKE